MWSMSSTCQLGSFRRSMVALRSLVPVGVASECAHLIEAVGQHTRDSGVALGPDKNIVKLAEVCFRDFLAVLAGIPVNGYAKVCHRVPKAARTRGSLMLLPKSVWTKPPVEKYRPLKPSSVTSCLKRSIWSGSPARHSSTCASATKRSGYLRTQSERKSSSLP